MDKGAEGTKEQNEYRDRMNITPRSKYTPKLTV